MLNILICVGGGNIEAIEITIFHKSMIINTRLRIPRICLVVLYKSLRIRKGQSRETGNIWYTIPRKNTTQYIGHRYSQTNTNNVKKR